MFSAVNTIPRGCPEVYGVWSEEEHRWRKLIAADFSISEVHNCIERLSSKKACGADNIFNEHLKAGICLTPRWTDLFNLCLQKGEIPTEWRSCIMIVIPKGKGNPLEPTSWRGICKKSCVYKLLSSLIVQRLVPFVEACGILPEEQHGFRPSHSTISACRILLDEINVALSNPEGRLFAVFVDFKSAFDSGSRDLTVYKLAQAGVPPRMLALITAFLGENSILIDDGVTVNSQIIQTTGFAQGDNLSPLLFSILIADLPQRVKDQHKFVKMLLYADDLVLFSTSRFHLQQALVTLGKYVKEIGLEINLQKTEAIKFRRGGKVARSDELRLYGNALRFVNSFTYLGVTLTVTGKSFSKHIAERFRKALISLNSIKNLRDLSLKTALELFDIKIAPCASYGIQLIWVRLSKRDLEKLDRVKSAFLKRVLGLHVSSRNRLVYLMAGTSMFVEDLQRRFSLDETPAFKLFIEEAEIKMATIEPEFFGTQAMVSDDWKGVRFTNRHLITRFASHGFHYVICSRMGFHEVSEECICVYCNHPAPKYHLMNCPSSPSISELNRIRLDVERSSSLKVFLLLST